MPRRRYHGGLASVSRPGSDPGSEPPADAVAMDHGCPRIQGAVRFRNLSGRHATTSELSTDSPATHAPATSGWTRCSGLARLAVPVFSPTAVESGRSHAAIPDRTRTSSSDLRPRMSLQLSKPLAVPAVPVRISTSVLPAWQSPPLASGLTATRGTRPRFNQVSGCRNTSSSAAQSTVHTAQSTVQVTKPGDSAFVSELTSPAPDLPALSAVHRA